MTTIKTMKLEVRELGKGWAMIDYLDVNKLDLLITENNIQEYVIYEINEVTLELEHVKTLFKGVKHVVVTGRSIGSSKHDCDNTMQSQSIGSEQIEIQEESSKVAKTEDKNINHKNSVKFEKTSYFILLGNKTKKHCENGYRAFYLDIPIIIHKDINNTWSVTLETSGKCISSNHTTRKNAYDKVASTIDKVGMEFFKSA